MGDMLKQHCQRSFAVAWQKALVLSVSVQPHTHYFTGDVDVRLLREPLNRADKLRAK